VACFKQWTYYVAAVAAVEAGWAGICASGIIEAGSVGALTPAAAATFAGSVATVIGGLATCIGTLIDLGDCYEQNGQHEQAAQIRQKVTALQHERDQLTALAARVRSAVGV
jgi:hypothetical protein